MIPRTQSTVQPVRQEARHSWRFWLAYTVLFCGVAGMGYACFFGQGKTLVWNVDAVGQYLPAFVYIGQWLREAFAGLLHGTVQLPAFDLSIGMGEDIASCLNYYGFGDPLNLLCIAATKANGAYVYTASFFLRLYLAGAAFCRYCAYMRLNRRLAIMGALCYSFCGFALSGGSRYLEFLSPMIYLPLILLGCEKLFRERRGIVLTLSVAYAALCNFYFLYMTSLFLALYCIVRTAFLYGRPSHMVKACLRCLLFYGIGACLAAPVLLPALSGFFQSLRTEVHAMDILRNPENWKPSAALFEQYRLGFHSNSGVVYWAEVPWIEFAALVSPLVFHRRARHKQCLLAVLLGSLGWCLPITSYVASGFGQPYTRWVFVLQFGYCVVLVCMAQQWMELLELHRTAARQRLFAWFVTACAAVNVVVGMTQLNGAEGLNWSQEFLTAEQCAHALDSPVNTSSTIQNDASLFRVSSDLLTGINGRPENVAMLNGYHGLTFWFSIVNGNTQRMVNQLGTKQQNSWRSYGLHHSAIYESLAAVKYYINDGSAAVPLGYRRMETVPFGATTWTVYRNRNALPLAYTYDRCMSEAAYAEQNEVERMETVLDTVVLSDTAEQRAQTTTRMRRMEPACRLSGSTLVLRYRVPQNTECYVYLLPQKNSASLHSIRLHGTEQRFRFADTQPVLTGLGGGFSQKTIELRMNVQELSADEVHQLIACIQLWGIGEEDLTQALAQRKKNAMQCVTLSKDRISGTISCAAPQYLLLAVPYHANWSAWVDGRETAVRRANTMYMAVKLGAGTHEVVFRYRARQQYAGILVAGCALLVLLLQARKITQKKKMSGR